MHLNLSMVGATRPKPNLAAVHCCGCCSSSSFLQLQ